MLNKTTTNDDDHHYHNVVVGDIILHCGSKIATIQVITRSLATIPPLTVNKPIIHRLLANSSGTAGAQTQFSCDLKNTATVKVTHERTKTSSSKKIIRMHKAGLALVKELKSKVVTSKNTSKTLTANTNDQQHVNTL